MTIRTSHPIERAEIHDAGELSLMLWESSGKFVRRQLSVREARALAVALLEAANEHAEVER